MFDVTIDDGHGGQVVRQITVLIDGQNPVPRMSVVATDGADPSLSTVYDTIANSQEFRLAAPGTNTSRWTLAH